MMYFLPFQIEVLTTDRLACQGGKKVVGGCALRAREVRMGHADDGARARLPERAESESNFALCDTSPV